MRDVLVESTEFPGGVRFFSRPAFRSGSFIAGICYMGLITGGYLYVVPVHWNQLSFSFVSSVYSLLLIGVVGTLCGVWRMHGRIHEMFLAGVVKVESNSALEVSLDVAARAIELWFFTACNALLIAVSPTWWGLRHAGVLSR